MRATSAICLAWLSMSCATPGPATPPSRLANAHAAPAQPAQLDDDAAALDAIHSVHGGAGPWVVAGYRMGRFALSRLNLPRGSFDLEVVHHSPREVQYACIADGAAAATGASLGRLTLSLEPAPAPDTRTTYRNKQTGASVTLKTTEAFAERFKDVPRERLSAAGKEVLHLQDQEIFHELP